MSQAQKRSSIAVVLVLVITALAVFAWSVVSGPGTHSAFARDGGYVVDVGSLHRALLRVGLSAEALAAVGATPNSAVGVVGNAKAYLDEHGAALAEADEACDANAAYREQLLRLIRSGHGTENDAQALSSAIAACASAQSERASLLDGLFSAAVAGLAGNQQAALANIRAGMPTGAPTHLAVQPRTDAEWLQLREALAARRYAAKSGEEVDAEAVYPLTVAEADQSVSAAMSNISSNTDDIVAAIGSAVAAQAQP